MLRFKKNYKQKTHFWSLEKVEKSSHRRVILLTSLAIVLDGRSAGCQALPAVKPQFLVLQLHLSQVLLDVDGRLLGVAAGWKLLGPVVLV